MMKGSTYFVSLDLAHGFNQIPMTAADMEKTAFRVGTGGLYEYTRMSFGRPRHIYAADGQGVC